MADIKVLMVCDGDRYTFGPPQAASDANAYYFGTSFLRGALSSSTTPTIQVDTAHRRGSGTTIAHNVDVTKGLTYPGDFVFSSNILSSYDVLWLIGDEGYNVGSHGNAVFKPIADVEVLAIADFMNRGGGVFAVGDHDGIGAFLCNRIPRIRTMRRWNEFDQIPVDQKQFLPNWSGGGVGYIQGSPDRNDTLQPDSVNGKYQFYDQSDPIPQTLLDSTGVALDSSAMPVHSILRGVDGEVIHQFPDHMHEGEATDLVSIGSQTDPSSGNTVGVPYDPNDAMGKPISVPFVDGTGQAISIIEFPSVGGVQPLPEVIAYTRDSGHVTFQQGQNFPASLPKSRGAISVYDGTAAGVGRIVTGSTFHHYLDKNLIGDPGTDGAIFQSAGSTLGLPGPVLDQMRSYYANVVTWLAPRNSQFLFVTVKSTFGADETQAALAQGTPFTNAFFLSLEGFAPSQLGLVLPAVTLSGPFVATGAQITPGSAILEDPGHPTSPQRILFPFTVVSISSAAFPAAGASAKELTLSARIVLPSGTLAATGEFELVAGADPYFVNVDPIAPAEWYLSQDLRVVQVTPGAEPTPFVPFTVDAYQYARDVLNFLNDATNGFTTPVGGDAFSAMNVVEATSVKPEGHGSHPNFYLAIARVRMRGAVGAQATNVRVFFRLFTTSTNDTDFDPNGAYRSVLDAANQPATPLPGTDNTSFPMYASQFGVADFNNGVNAQTITVSANGETWAYFACYLDVFNNPDPAFHLNGTHHCLVAQIAYDGAPIVNSNGLTLSPENSDKLAQRNIQITTADNPGGPLAHRVPQTFDLRPSKRAPSSVSSLAGRPDELMIDWGRVPSGTEVTLYWPQVDSQEVMHLALMLYVSSPWVAVDAHTLKCRVDSGVAYLPIPFASNNSGFAGLFTMDLPQGIRRGQRFQVVVRRLRTRTIRPTGKVVARSKQPGPVANSQSRYVVGTFQIAIPVATAATMLEPEENTLSIMKWRLNQTPMFSRWRPVLERYVEILAGRVEGLGGDPKSVVPSPLGLGGNSIEETHGKSRELTGRVVEVIYDCLGRLEGFVVATCREDVRVACDDRMLGRILVRACRHHDVVSVCVSAAQEQRVLQVIVRPR